MDHRLVAALFVTALTAAGTSCALAHDPSKHHHHNATESMHRQYLDEMPIPSLDGKLIDTTGQPTDLETLLGEDNFVLSFSYLNCPEQCPNSDLVMNKLAQDLSVRADAPQLVTLTLDPEHDSSHRLAAHHAEFGSPSNWRWATGEPASVHRLLRRLGVETGAPLEQHEVVFFVGSLRRGVMTPVNGLASPEVLLEIAQKYKRIHKSSER